MKLTVKDIIYVIDEFVEKHDIKNYNLMMELYVNCLYSDHEEESVNLILNYTYNENRKLIYDNLYIEELHMGKKDIVINYDLDYPMLQEDMKKLLTILTPYERSIIVLRFYENLSIEEVSSQIKVDTNRLKQEETSILNKLKENSGDLICYLHTQ